MLSLRLCQQLLFYNLIFKRIIKVFETDTLAWKEEFSTPIIHAFSWFLQIKREPELCFLDIVKGKILNQKTSKLLCLWLSEIQVCELSGVITAVMVQDDNCGFYGNKGSKWSVFKIKITSLNCTSKGETRSWYRSVNFLGTYIYYGMISEKQNKQEIQINERKISLQKRNSPQMNENKHPCLWMVESYRNTAKRQYSDIH